MYRTEDVVQIYFQYAFILQQQQGEDQRGRVEVKRWGGVGGSGGRVTGLLMNVSRAVWGGFGYQGAAGVHSVVFRS